MPEPNNGIVNEVVIELDWTMAVIMVPKEKLDKSLLNKYLSRRTWNLSRVKYRIDETMYFRAVNRRINAITMPILGPVIARSLEDTGLVINFKGLTKVSPPISLKAFAMMTAIFSMKWNFNSKGNSTQTLSKLKKSWTVAPAKALLNSSFRAMWPKETRTLVTVVPMLAPMMMGIAFGMVNPPPPTKATTTEVVAEELWTIEVERMPVTRPT